MNWVGLASESDANPRQFGHLRAGEIGKGFGLRGALAVSNVGPPTSKLLRSSHRITVAVSAVLNRGPVRQATTSFAVTVRAPARGRR